MNKKTFLYSFKATLPVLAGYLLLGAGFGMMLENIGYGPLWAFLMALVVYAGSGQYVAVDLIAGGATLISSALITLAVNIRHLFYGLSLLKPFRASGGERYYMMFALTDETFSLQCVPELPENIDERGYRFFISILDHIYWISGCVLGNIVGALLPFSTEGVDFTMTALFIVIFLEQWEKSSQHLPAITGIIVSVAALLLSGPDSFLLPAMIGIAICLFLERPLLRKAPEKEEEADG